MKRIQQLFSLYLLLFLSVCLYSSCEEEYHIDSREISDAIAFDGVITNEPPPYFFRLTHVASIGEYEDGVVDAQIVVTDHTVGLKDTMKLLTPIKEGMGLVVTYYDYHSKKQVVDGLNNFKANGDGIYVTTKIYGVENHRYTLDILYKGEHHIAEEIMVPKTPITAMTVKEVDLGEKGKKMAPCINFVNRQGEENYYLLKTDRYSTKVRRVAWINRFFNAENFWPFSILSDEYLEENVQDFIVSEGEQNSGAPGINYPQNSDSLFVWMQSISKACYDCYGEMIEQLRTDGGAYTPRPVTVRSNISGGVLGLFRVSAISERYVLLKNRK